MNEENTLLNIAITKIKNRLDLKNILTQLDNTDKLKNFVLNEDEQQIF